MSDRTETDKQMLKRYTELDGLSDQEIWDKLSEQVKKDLANVPGEVYLQEFESRKKNHR